MAEDIVGRMRSHNSVMRGENSGGFTLIELLVVMSIISMLTGILLPAMGKAKRSARMLVGISNQRQAVNALLCYEFDNDGLFPESVATIGTGQNWHWQEPTMLTAYRKRDPQTNRSMSAYLSSYIADVDILFSPDAPEKYKYLEQLWEAGDAWDNPDTMASEDPAMGTYCFYWSYKGYLPEDGTVFRGPRNSCGGRMQSELLASDYFGYDHWRSPKAYGGSVPFNDSQVTSGTPISSAFWSRAGAVDGGDLGTIEIKLRAAYVDGHVETYSASEVVPMKVPITADGTEPYPDGVGAGDFYLPAKALH